jgi:uncharacterized protein (DUF2225 family)
MIHYRPEGKYYKIGLNITCGRNGWLPWIAFAWIWYNVEKREMFKWYLRLRSLGPAYFYSCYRQNVVNSYLYIHGLTTVPDTFVEDISFYVTDKKILKEFLRNHG